MKKVGVLALTLVAILTVGCTQAPTASETKPADTKAQDTADIKALEEGVTAAFKAKDIDKVMSFYVADESAIIFDAVPPRQYVGATAYKKDFEGLVAMFPTAFDVTISDVDVTVGGGDVAYGHSIQHVMGTMKDGKKVDFTVRVTDGYKRVNGKWLIAHEHVSVPVDVLTGKADLASKP
jgi:uncharacterized protein (TIGR02246 family)